MLSYPLAFPGASSEVHSVRSRGAGIFARPMYDAGDRVRAGECLGRVEDATLTDLLRRFRFETCASLPPSAYRSEGLEQLRQEGRRLAAEAELLSDDLAMVRKLAATDAMPEVEVLRATRRSERAADLLAANERRQLATEVDLARGRSKVASITSIARHVEHEAILAPSDGQIVAWLVEPGRTVVAGEPLVRLLVR
jgi:biotin carboxyl carrier protein